MTKEKKVTIKHYLNKRLKAKEYNNELLYPSYVRVVFDRKSALFPFDWSRDLEFEDKPYKNYFSENEYKAVLKSMECYILEQNSMIEGIIRYEYKNLRDKFKMKGIGERFTFYRTSVYDGCFQNAQSKIMDILKPHLNEGEVFDLRRMFTTELIYTTENDYNIEIPSNLLEYFELHVKGTDSHILLYLTGLLTFAYKESKYCKRNRMLNFYDFIIEKDLEPIKKILKFQTYGEELETAVINKIITIVNSMFDRLYPEV